jgi:glycerophosphoryl diester phosphodiesterase
MTPFRRPPQAPPRIYGHRGVRGPVTENTLAAFDRAHQEGADGVELDVRLCKTGELVVLHDPDLRRVTSGRDPRAVRDLSLPELRRVRLDQDLPIPTLSELLRWAQPRRLLLQVEVKGDTDSHRALVRAVQRELGAIPGVERMVLVSSFYPQILLGLWALRCPFGLAQLFHEGQRGLHPWELGRVARVDALHPERGLVQGGPVARARGAGQVVNVWTVNEEQEARRLARQGVDGLITDRPGAIGAAVRGEGR